MSRNIVKPKSVSFEDALRNLASRLTGHPTAELPRTQEGIVQFMAENVPSVNEMAEAVTQEVLARLEAAAAAPVDEEPEKPGTGQQESHNGPDTSGGTLTPGEGEEPNTAAPVAASTPKRGRGKAAK